ncbi:hypothetical protein N6H14_18290 [Paenibacillus sp. CC-CFT747]|nr:hypothetical protein N6H14_18290 [Paenibacillus sp. CC-CFT747]
MRTENWWGYRSDGTRSRIREMYGSTVGCIGAGHAGRHYMELLRPYGVRLLLNDPTLTREQADAWGAELVDLDTLCARSDVVTVLAPELPETYRMIDAGRLERMKEGATLINLARGSLVDEEALITELKRGRIRACLDVTDPEPPPADHPFRTLPNVVLTGHIAGAVNNGLHALGRFAVEEYFRFREERCLAGEVLPSSLNTKA